ncbi:MAG: DUF4864 domain-containing protein [Maritimibacter sp.]|nr:DUF4864 domain-containing protein [Maritimibacter sp.]
MKQILLAAILAAGVVFGPAQPLAADPASDGIQATISSQIDAFRAGDMAGAFDFASQGIRQIFGTAETFGGMVERGYAMVIDPSELRYGDLRSEAAGPVQRVLVRDAGGVWHALDYLMVEEDGVWRIGGVEIVTAPPVGA